MSYISRMYVFLYKKYQIKRNFISFLSIYTKKRGICIKHIYDIVISTLTLNHTIYVVMHRHDKKTLYTK